MPRRVDPEAVGRLGTILTEYANIDNLLGPPPARAHQAAPSVHQRAAHSGRWGRSHRAAHSRCPLRRVRRLAPPRRRQPPGGGLLVRPGNGLGPGRWQRPHGVLRPHAQEQPSIQPGRCQPNPRAGSAALRGQDWLSPRARALALRQEARGHALSDDPTGCARALDAARDQAAAPEDQSEEDRILTGYCTPAFIEMEAADCAMLLGQPPRPSSPSSTAWRPCRRSISAIEQSTWPGWRSPMRPAKSRNWPVPSPKRPPPSSTAPGRRGPWPSSGGCQRCCRDGRTWRRSRSWRQPWRPCPEVLGSWLWQASAHGPTDHHGHLPR